MHKNDIEGSDLYCRRRDRGFGWGLYLYQKRCGRLRMAGDIMAEISLQEFLNLKETVKRLEQKVKAQDREIERILEYIIKNKMKG